MATNVHGINDIINILVGAVKAELVMPATPMLLSVSDVSKRIGRSIGATRQLIARGHISAVRCDRRVFVESKELERWIERNRV